MYKAFCFTLLWLGLMNIPPQCYVHASQAPSPTALRAQYKAAPILLTRENIHLLEEAGLITTTQKKAYLSYINEDNPLYRLEDLGLLPAWDKSTIEAIRPYVKLAPVARTKPREKNARKSTQKKKTANTSEVIVCVVPSARQHKKPRQQKNQDEGHEAELVGTYIMKKKGTYDIGLLAYKGVGEPLRYAFYRLYVVIEGKIVTPLLKRIIFGKYNAKVGQGLVLNSGAQREETLSSKFAHPKNLLTPVKSKNRNDGLTGGALHFASKKLEWLVYTAYNPYFATLYDGTKKEKDAQPAAAPYVQSLSSSYTTYRNTAMWEEKSKFNEKLLGGAMIYHPTPSSSIGATYLHSHYNYAYKPAKGHFNQRKNNNASVFGHLKHNNHHLIGELALSSPGKQMPASSANQQLPVGVGYALGNKITLGKKHQLMLHYAYYAPNFHCFHGNNSHINKNTLQVGYQHPLLGSTISHTLKGTQNIILGKKNLPYEIKHETEMSYKWDKQSTLEAKYKGTIKPEQPFLPILKLKWKYVTQACVFNTALTFATQLGSAWYKMISCSFCENLAFDFKAFTVKLHLTLFYTKAKAAFYHYTPDIKSGTLFPKTAGQGIRLGLIFIYRVKKYLSLQWQCYSSFGIQGSGKPFAATPRIKFQLTYNM